MVQRIMVDYWFKWFDLENYWKWFISLSTTLTIDSDHFPVWQCDINAYLQNIWVCTFCKKVNCRKFMHIISACKGCGFGFIVVMFTIHCSPIFWCSDFNAFSWHSMIGTLIYMLASSGCFVWYGQWWSNLLHLLCPFHCVILFCELFDSGLMLWKVVIGCFAWNHSDRCNDGV